MVNTVTPGVYVVEVPSGLAPIAGASTNTVGFIGFLPAGNTAEIPVARKGYNPRNGASAENSVKLKDSTGKVKTETAVASELTGQTLKTPLKLTLASVDTLMSGTGLSVSTITKLIDGIKPKTANDPPGKLSLTKEVLKAEISAVKAGDILLVGVRSIDDDAKADSSNPQNYPLIYGAGHKLDDADIKRIAALQSIQSISVQRDLSIGSAFNAQSDTSVPTTDGWQLKDSYKFSTPQQNIEVFLPTTRPLTKEEAGAAAKKALEAPNTPIDIQGNLPYTTVSVAVTAGTGTAKLYTSFSQFKQELYGSGLERLDDDGKPQSLSGFPDPKQQNSDLSYLIHAVYGFFSNGGTRCYVLLLNSGTSLDENALNNFDAIEEISLIVAAKATITAGEQKAIADYCEGGANQGNFYRFAIFDSPKDSTIRSVAQARAGNQIPGNTNYAAFYYPWIKVADPATKIMDPQGAGLLDVPPSGHIAGVYARVDNLRGVHKAPANEVIFGALGVTQSISKNDQAGLNPDGVNCIRDLNGNIRIWGARTLGGDANGEFMYISTRRLFLYLRHSIDKATQWTVFEPNNPELWAKIRRNITAFLTNTWRTGALFGTTPQEAFYVKCDAENNPPEVRDLGQVVIEIGVAVTKPAEFVIFRISQWAGPGA